MAKVYSDIVGKLPKPETTEEQYMYALVCKMARTKEFVPFPGAFWRLEKYWQAYYEVMSLRNEEAFEYAIESITSQSIADGAVTEIKLANNVKNRLLGEKNVSSDNIKDNSVGFSKLDDDIISELNRPITKDDITDGEITWDLLADSIKTRITTLETKVAALEAKNSV